MTGDIDLSIGSPNDRAHEDEINRERMRAALQKFVDHYPPGINPFLDEAYRMARDALAALTSGHHSEGKS